MTNAHAILDTLPTDPAARAAWVRTYIPTDPHRRSVLVQAWLKAKGETFASLARQHGKDRRAIAMSLRVPSYPMERVLAAALGLTVPELFPERYTPDGSVRLHRVRSDDAHDSGHRLPRNVEDHGGCQP